MSDGIPQDLADFALASGGFLDNNTKQISPQKMRNFAASIIATFAGVDDTIADALATYDVEVQGSIADAVNALEVSTGVLLATKASADDLTALAIDAVLHSALSPAINDFLAAATVDDAQAYLALSVGVNVQAHSDDLDDFVAGIAGLGVNDQMLYRDATGGWHAVVLDETLSLFEGTLSAAGGAVSDALQVLEDTPRACSGRLTLTSGTPVTTADVTSASTVYWTPYEGNLLWIFDGTAWVPYAESEKSVALSGLTSAKKYDIFAYRNAGETKIDLGPAWTDANNRSAAVSQLNGIHVNTSSITMVISGDVVASQQATLLGTILTTGTSTTADSAAARNVLNHFNFFTVERQANDLLISGQTLIAYLTALNAIATGAANLTSATAGTATASKALITNASNQIAGLGWLKGGAIEIGSGTTLNTHALLYQPSSFALGVRSTGTTPIIIRLEAAAGGNATAHGIGWFGADLAIISNGTGGTLRVRNLANTEYRDLECRHLTASGVFTPPPYTFATMPAASTYTGGVIRITDRSQRLAYSDGTDWKWLADDTVVS